MEDQGRKFGDSSSVQTNSEFRPHVDAGTRPRHSPLPFEDRRRRVAAPEFTPEPEPPELSEDEKHSLARAGAARRFERTFPNINTGASYMSARTARREGSPADDVITDDEFWSFNTKANRHGNF